MRKNSSEFKTSFVSEAGTFRNNKDYFAYVESDDIACWVAVDGIDSDEEKKSAEIVAQTIFSEFLERPSLSRRKLRRTIINANNALKTESRSVRLKASMVVVISDYTRMIWAVSGNARFYHFRKKRFSFRSKDQSIAQMMVDSGKISDDDINEHEERHNLIRYLGMQGQLRPYISRKMFLNDGDVMLLCTPGFWENIKSIELIDTLKETEDPEELTSNLEEIILGKQNEVLNNYTLGAIFANKVFKDNTEGRLKKFRKIALAAALLLVVIVIVAFGHRQIRAMRARAVAKVQENKRKAELVVKIDENEAKGDEFVKEGKFKNAYTVYQEALNGIKLLDEKQKDMGQEEKLQEKFDITRVIVEGDDHFAKKKYNAALMNYQSADRDAALIIYDRKELQHRIEKTRGYMQVIEMVNQGDYQNDKGDYVAAKQSYTQASSLAEKYSFDSMKDTLGTKMVTLEAKLAESQERKKQYNSAKRFERQGDQKYSAKKYKESLDFFNMAKVSYEELGMTEEVMVIQTKIQNNESRLERYDSASRYAKQGDEKFAAKKFKDAKEAYAIAKSIFTELNMPDEVAAIEPKLEEAEKQAKWINRLFGK